MLGDDRRGPGIDPPGQGAVLLTLRDADDRSAIDDDRRLRAQQKGAQGVVVCDVEAQLR